MVMIASIAVELTAITALVLTIRQRRKMELPVFLYLVAFESTVILAAAWVLVIHGAIIEMGHI